MSNTLQVLEKKLSRPTTIKEAIEMDSRLGYVTLPVDLQKEIVEDKEMETVIYNGLTMTSDVLKQIRRYQLKEISNAQLIVYTDEDNEKTVVKAVSGVFQPIPLKDVWIKAVERLGEPIVEKATNQAIIAQFEPVMTKYKQDGTIADTDYEVKPTLTFSYNFAERAFQLGFVVGVFHCLNQIFTFFGDSRIIHNRHKIAHNDFSIEKAIDNLMLNLTRLEEIIKTAQCTPLPDFATPILYWKGARGQTKVLEQVYEQHAKLVAKKGKDELTLWDAIMNLTWVSTHQIGNYNSSVDMSMVAGKTLLDIGELLPEDYVKGLGWYMEHKRRTSGQTWKQEAPIFQRIDLVPLMNFTRAVINKQARETEVIAIEKEKQIEQAKEITTTEFQNEVPQDEEDPSVPSDVQKYFDKMTPDDKDNMFKED